MNIGRTRQHEYAARQRGVRMLAVIAGVPQERSDRLSEKISTKSQKLEERSDRLSEKISTKSQKFEERSDRISLERNN